MKITSTIPGGIALALVFAAAYAAPAPAAPTDAGLRYQRERAACFNGPTVVDREACLREAGAALQEARRGGLAGANESELAQNRVARCKVLPPSDQEDCARRMSGEGSASGSVGQGGILREFKRTLPPGSQ